jgi:FkbM family methyltransferase
MASQLGQDLFVLEVLGGMRGGFYLDSGAADGVIASNTLLLESSYGWNGICIEPDKAYFAALVRNRRCHCLNCCLFNYSGTVDFLEAGTLGGVLGEYHPAHLEFVRNRLRLPKDPEGRPSTVKKAARTLRSVLQECGAPRIIDYWSLDTEGSELTILKSFPFDAYSFRVLTIEHNGFSVRDEIRAFLEARGYWRVRDMGIDDCYVTRGDLPSRSWRSKAWNR